jgi:hypothetical protein
MGWGPDFTTMLDGNLIEPRYLLEQIKIGSFSAATRPLKLSSFDQPPYFPYLVRAGSSISYGSLTPGDWSRTWGQATFAILGDVREMVTRGMAVSLKVGFAGWDVGRFESVWLGVVRNLRWERGLWYLDAVELPGALQNRFDDASDQQNLFYILPQKTKLDVPGYDPGADGFTVLDATGFEKETGSDYVARITPTGSNVYYVTATTRAVAVFSGTTGGAFDSPLNNHHPPGIGTPDSADANDTCEAIAWVQAHPITFALKILLSTGNGSNGSLDTLPVSWSYGIPRTFVDHQDADAFKRATLPSPAYWDFLVDHSQADGVSWLAEQLRPGGFFVSQYQGRLTVRAITQYTGPTPGSVDIDDSDLVDLRYQTWDDESPVEYKQVRVLGYNNADPTSFSEENFATRPTRTSRRRDLPQAFSAVSAGWTTEVGNRLGPYDTRVPERLTLTCRGWRAARCSPGDFVTLKSSYYQRRDQVGSHGVGTSFYQALVVGGGPDWFGSTTTLEVLVIAPASDLE